MRTGISLTLLALLFANFSMAQGIETDDMYFNSKDRAKLREQNAAASLAMASKKNDRREVSREESLNPTDSYSARTVNPEFSSRANAETAQIDNEDYFVTDYRYQTAQQLSSFNNNFNNWYNSSWYTRNYWGPSIHAWNSPFYGSYYNPWGNPWNDPFYRANYSSSFSYYWGSNWNYGWGFNNYWNHPMNNWGWGSAWGPSYAWGPSFGFGFGNGWGSWYGPGWYGGGAPRVVVVNNNYSEGGRKVVYGKRPERSTSYATSQPNTRTRTSYTPDTGNRPSSGGRTASTPEYYNKSWRYTSPENSSGNSNSAGSTPNTTTRTRQSTYSNDGFGNSSNSGYNPSYTPSRSSNSSFGGSNSSSGSRSSSPAPSGGSNGRSRGGR